MDNYLNLLQDILDNGTWEMNERTGHSTKRVFGRMMRFDLQKGFPLLTTKKMAVKTMWHELIWFLKGVPGQNIKYLRDNNIKIWDEWADSDGYIGPVYGYQWRNWPAFKKDDASIGPLHDEVLREVFIDQLSLAIQKLKQDPSSRQNIVSAWNVGSLPDMRLPPCHILFQLLVTKKSKLTLVMFQRSADVFLGLPFDIASYATLVHIIAKQTGLVPSELVVMLGDVHIYDNQVDVVREQLTRNTLVLPEIAVNYKEKLEDYCIKDFSLLNYVCHPALKVPVIK